MRSFLLERRSELRLQGAVWRRRAVSAIVFRGIAAASAATLVMSCAPSAEDACKSYVNTECEKSFECMPDGGMSLLVGNVSNCGVFAEQSCSTQVCSNPPCCAEIESDGGIRFGTINGGNASTCSTELAGATCDQVATGAYDTSGACSRTCQ